jgi:hypothetical protein
MELSAAEQRWFALVEEFEQSGLSRAQFCQQRKLKVRTFAWYRSRWRSRRAQTMLVQQPPAFVELALPKPLTPLILRLERRALTLEVPVGADLGWLRTVLDALC